MTFECSSWTVRSGVAALGLLGLLLGGVPAAGHAGEGSGEDASPAGLEGIRLELELDPDSGGVRGIARLELDPENGGSRLELELLEALTVDAVTRDGVDLRWEEKASPVPEDVHHEGVEHLLPHPKRRVLIELDPRPSDGVTRDVAIRYHGVLQEDWATGEQVGEIHNFAVEAHVGTDGIYLSSGVPWYPQLPFETGDGEPSVPLLDHELTLRGVPGMLLVASGNRVSVGDPEVGADEVWRTPFPIPAMAVAGGTRRAHIRRVGEVVVVAHLSEDSARFADTLLDAAASYLELYQPLVGAYPFREFTIVENFFSSGFAYPGFTLLASAVIQMGESSLRPGYLDHEMLHAWWGNGVLRTQGEGIWSEGLASYCANLMRDVLEGRDAAAAAHRRSIFERLSQLDPEVDKPLATFGTDDGASRFIGYQKGSVVFGELGRQVGTDRLWYALRNLAATRMGRFTTWDDLQESFERSTGRDLGAFFDFWVRGSGIPDVSPRTAWWTAAASSAGGTLRLGLPGPVPVAVPGLELRLTGGGEPTVETVDVPAGASALEIALERRPEAVEVDPEHRAMRRLPPEVWMPTISGISASKPLRLLRARNEEAELDERYEVVANALRGRYEKRGELSEERIRVRRRGEPWDDGHLLLLGDAALAPQASELLAAARLELDPEAKSFTLEGVEHAAPTDSVMACVRRPREAGAVACIVWGNSPQALERAHLLTFYGGDSLLRFEEGRPVERRRFEGVERIEVEDAG